MIAGSIRPGTDVALTFEMSLGVTAAGSFGHRRSRAVHVKTMVNHCERGDDMDNLKKNNQSSTHKMCQAFLFTNKIAPDVTI